jgi:hypothetical protein
VGKSFGVKPFVIPAQAGIQSESDRANSLWIPACAGMTEMIFAKPAPTQFLLAMKSEQPEII